MSFLKLTKIIFYDFWALRFFKLRKKSKGDVQHRSERPSLVLEFFVSDIECICYLNSSFCCRRWDSAWILSRNFYDLFIIASLFERNDGMCYCFFLYLNIIYHQIHWILFRQHLSAENVCLLSRYSLFTSCYYQIKIHLKCFQISSCNEVGCDCILWKQKRFSRCVKIKTRIFTHQSARKWKTILLKNDCEHSCNGLNLFAQSPLIGCLRFRYKQRESSNWKSMCVSTISTADDNFNANGK